MDMRLSKLWELVMDREPGMLQFMRSQGGGHYWATELNWIEALLSMEFSRQESWSGSHSLLQGIFLTQGSNPHVLHQQADSFTIWATREAPTYYHILFLEIWVQFSRSVVSDFLRPRGPQHLASLSITNSQSLLKLMSIELVMPSNHLILCRPLLCLPSIFPSISSFPVNQLFTSDGKVLEFQLQHQSFQWTPRTDLL